MFQRGGTYEGHVIENLGQFKDESPINKAQVFKIIPN